MLEDDKCWGREREESGIRSAEGRGRVRLQIKMWWLG